MTLALRQKEILWWPFDAMKYLKQFKTLLFFILPKFFNIKIILTVSSILFVMKFWYFNSYPLLKFFNYSRFKWFYPESCGQKLPVLMNIPIIFFQNWKKAIEYFRWHCAKLRLDSNYSRNAARSSKIFGFPLWKVLFFHQNFLLNNWNKWFYVFYFTIYFFSFLSTF